MKKLMSAMLVGIMALGIAGIMLVQPVKVQAAAADPFKDFDVSVGTDGKVVIDSEMDKTNASPIGTIIDKYKGFIAGVSGIAAVTMVVLFIMNFLKLGAAGDNPSARKGAIGGIIWTGISAALLGSVSLITGIFYGFMS